MARGGINKAVVQKARDALIARNVHPSIDAVRVALGNTGSKSTIQRYLKELNACAKPVITPTLDEELSSLISTIAVRLADDARAAVSEQQAHLDETGRQQLLAQAQHRELIDALQQSNLRLTSEVETLTERDRQHQLHVATLQRELATSQQQFKDASATIAYRNQELDKLQANTEQARTSLSHFREEQRALRDKDLERHEQQLQDSKKESLRLQNALTQKQEELTTLYRDHERAISEHHQSVRNLAALERALATARSQLAQLTSAIQQERAHAQNWQNELAETRSRLRLALGKQRTDAQRIRNQQKQIGELHGLLAEVYPSSTTPR